MTAPSRLPPFSFPLSASRGHSWLKALAAAWGGGEQTAHPGRQDRLTGQTAKCKICKTAKTIGGPTKALMFSKKIFSVPCFYFLISVSHAHTHPLIPMHNEKLTECNPVLCIIPGHPEFPGMRTTMPVFSGIKNTSGNEFTSLSHAWLDFGFTMYD